jgi:hypothetical protein
MHYQLRRRDGNGVSTSFARERPNSRTTALAEHAVSASLGCPTPRASWPRLRGVRLNFELSRQPSQLRALC